MSYDEKTEAGCSWCEKRIDLNCDDYTVRLGDELHADCAKEWDNEHGGEHDHGPTEAELTAMNGNRLNGGLRANRV